MQQKHYAELSKKIGFILNVKRQQEEGEAPPGGVTDHPILSLINLSRLKKTALRVEYNNTEIPFTWHEVEYVSRSFDGYKQE